MACAVPVIATAVGGLPEVVVPGETGFLTPKGDVAAMIAHGLRVLRDGALHARMRAAAARRARSEEHTSELQSQSNLVCRLLLEKKKHTPNTSQDCAPSTPVH